MKLIYFLNSSAPEISEAAKQGATPPVFWVIVGVLAVCFVIFVIQNFVIKKEEYYK